MCFSLSPPLSHTLCTCCDVINNRASTSNMDDVDRSASCVCTAVYTHTHTRHAYLHKRFYAVPPQQASLHALHLRVRERKSTHTRRACGLSAEKKREMLIDSKVSHEVNAVNDSYEQTHTHTTLTANWRL